MSSTTPVSPTQWDPTGSSASRAPGCGALRGKPCRTVPVRRAMSSRVPFAWTGAPRCSYAWWERFSPLRWASTSPSLSALFPLYSPSLSPLFCPLSLPLAHLSPQPAPGHSTDPTLTRTPSAGDPGRSGQPRGEPDDRHGALLQFLRSRRFPCPFSPPPRLSRCLSEMEPEEVAPRQRTLEQCDEGGGEGEDHAQGAMGEEEGRGAGRGGGGEGGPGRGKRRGGRSEAVGGRAGIIHDGAPGNGDVSWVVSRMWTCFAERRIVLLERSWRPFLLVLFP